MSSNRESIFNQEFNNGIDVIDFKKYFQEYAQLLSPIERCQEDKCYINELGCEKINCKNDEYYINMLGISIEELKELKKRTSVELLTCEEETKPVPYEFYKKYSEVNKFFNKKSKASDSLISVKARKEMLDKKDVFPRTYFKYCNHQWLPLTDSKIKAKLNFHSDDFSTVVTSVKIYHPFLSSIHTVRVKLLQEIHILGNQTLAQLRDNILCYLDYVGVVDVSNDCHLKEVGLNITAKDEYPSSFIFVDKTFYNDARTPNLLDLSKELREWASQNNLGFFNCACMEQTQICDLKFQIGRPYVFQHQGNCEHLLVFSDIRFLEFNDPIKQNAYPRVHATGRIYGKHCMMCSNSYAKWLVIGSERLTHDKCYLCKKCYFSYNYINGRKVGEFEAYKYVDPVAIL